MQSDLPLPLFGAIFADILEIFIDTYSTKRKYRNSKFLQRLSREVRFNEFLVTRVRLLATTLDAREADTLGAHIIHRVIEYFYAESEMTTLTDETPLTSPKPSGECLVGGWALRSARQFFSAWVHRAAADKLPLLQAAIGIIDLLTVPFTDVHRVASSTADAHFRELNAGGLRLPVSGLLVLFADVHRKFNSLIGAHVIASRRQGAIMHAEGEIINHVQLRLVFSSLCDEVKLSAPTTGTANPTILPVQAITRPAWILSSSKVSMPSPTGCRMDESAWESTCARYLCVTRRVTRKVGIDCE